MEQNQTNPIQDNSEESQFDKPSRTIMLLLYPDNPEHKTILEEKLPSSGYDYVGRIHDMDEDTKPHFHVVLSFPNVRRRSEISKELGIEKRFLEPKSRLDGAIRYLVHADNPEKYQYDNSGLFGTLVDKAIRKINKTDPVAEPTAILAIIDYLDSFDGTITYSDVIRGICNMNLFSYFRRMGVLATRLIDEHNFKIASKEHQTLQREKRAETFEKVRSLEFSERCERLERKGLLPEEISNE